MSDHRLTQNVSSVDGPLAEDSAGRSSVSKEAMKSEPAAKSRRKLPPILGLRNLGGVYVWLFIIAIFTLTQPETFPTIESVRSIANTYAISGVIALAVIIPLIAGVFDISVGYTMGLAGTLSAWMMAETSSPWWLAVLVGIGAGVIVGLINAGVVVMGKITPIIATLATGSIIAAATTAISSNNSIVKNVGGAFSENVAGKQIWGFSEPFIILLILMVVLGVLLEATKTGRYLYAVGFDADTARLAGVRVKGLQTMALVVSGTLAASAGVMLTARIGASSPGSGPPYLLPAFAGAFLGATMFRNGRFNAWGTVVATMLLGTGQFGILLSGGPVWSPDVFNGVALIVAVGFASMSLNRPAMLRRFSRVMRRPRSRVSESSDNPSPSG